MFAICSSELIAAEVLYTSHVLFPQSVANLTAVKWDHSKLAHCMGVPFEDLKFDDLSHLTWDNFSHDFAANATPIIDFPLGSVNWIDAIPTIIYTRTWDRSGNFGRRWCRWGGRG